MKTVTVPLGEKTKNLIFQLCQEKNGKIQRWRDVRVIKLCKNNKGISYSALNRGRYSKRCPYIKWDYHPTVVSSAIVFPSVILYKFNKDKRIKIKAPNGYFWNVDDYGLRLVNKRTKADYHPNNEELWDGVETIVKKLRENYLKQKEITKTQKNFEQKVKKIKIGFWDSINAGNCEVGTLGFIKQNHLDRWKRYSYSFFKKIGLTNNEKVLQVFRYKLNEIEKFKSLGAEVFY